MFKRKKKKTGVQTPEFRKPTTPPPPQTSGSNARKPNPNYVPPASVIVDCGHQPTYTSTQNPPNTFSSLLKATSLQVLPNDIGTVTYVCLYELPCGWCTKWDKQCDKKIGCEPPSIPMPESHAQKIINEIKSGKLPSIDMNDTYGLETRG